VNRIITAVHQLRNTNLNVPDEWIGSLLLAGLPDEYRPMIMALESSGIDLVKMKILQKVKNKESATVLYTKRDKPKVKNKGPRCYRCNRYGHFAKECTKRISDHESSSNKTTKASSSGSNNEKDEKNKNSKSKKEKTFCAFYTSDQSDASTWYVDSFLVCRCASTHVSSDECFEKINDNPDTFISTASGRIKELRQLEISNCESSHDAETFRVTDVLHAPDR